ncbi:Gamma-tubulin complex component 3 -like protein [Triplophysa tibetana]|uniref:Gamma-tubulin complex component 3-like protein n=1 Tax=Triplophysa tibetana TaxID=1572043 RepID=A0A5A9PLV6_9TELE|nr:Gamma-tubulin complex component 3 -like protein [Triplophysa tibetana]
MAALDQKSPNVLLQSLCCKITGKSEAEVAHQFQYAVRVIGSNYAPTIERDEFLVSEKIKKELLKQRREADAALFSELHRKLQTQGVLKHRWSILYLLLSLCEDPKKPSSRVGTYGSLFAQALPRDVHSTPFYYARPQSLPLSYPERSAAAHNSSMATSGISSMGVFSINGPGPTTSLLTGPGPQAVGESMRGSRLAWTVPVSGSPSGAAAATRPPSGPSASPAPKAPNRQRRDGDGSAEIGEAALVRDLLYVFQGIDGKFVKMSSPENSYKIDPKVPLCKSLRDTSSRLAELGWLHNKIRKYTDSHSLDRAFGLVGQSFCAALHQELKEYYRLLSVLHAQVSVPQIQVEDDQGVNDSMESSLTLRRLLVWTYDPKVRLKTLAALVDYCQGRKGGELASAVHAYGKTGDPHMRALIQHILGLVSHPILNFLYRWIYDGELEDTYHEFFVASDPTVKADRLWHDKYSLRKSMIPSFITMDKARKVLLIGKSINFLHQVCQDRTPPGKIMPSSKSSDSPKDATELFTDLEGAFQSKIDAAYFETSKYLLDVLNKNYQLLEHLQAMRRYLLLGQGDFIRHLMDLLKPELVRAATTLYQHNLTGILETAVRATNAQFDSPEILKRLDVRLLEVSPGDTGWDVFSLDYHVDGPIATVFTRECMSHYLRVFNFLWRAKRMEYILTDIWKGQMCNAKLLKSMPELSGVLHQCHVLASEMVHFIHQMQYYITFEVLECSWDELWNKVHQARDLDHIIAAHDVFLDTIISRCLLDVNNRSLLNQLRAVFDQIIEFQSAQDALYRSALEELQLRVQYEDKKKQREEMGEWGVTAEQEAAENKRVQEYKDTIPKMCSQLRLLTHFYQGIVREFLRLLMTCSDESLQFLSFRLDFNEHYKTRDPRLRPSLGASRGRRSSNI